MVSKVQLLTLLATVAVSLAQNTRGGGGFVGVIAGGFGGGGGGCGGGGCGGGFGGGGCSGGGCGGGFGGGGGGCRYWCRTNFGQYYCCEGGGSNNVHYPVVKPGRCPPVRPQCPPVRTFRPPSTCSSDSSCGGSDKCCYDTCLRHHTCKPPNFYG